MSLVERAQEIRQRLRNPPNAVLDTGIDLKRKTNDTAPVSPPIEPEQTQISSIRSSPSLRSVDQILKIVAHYYGYKIDEMLHPLHTRPFVRVRSIAAYMVRRCTTVSLSNIGKLMGGRDHTFIIHNINLAKNRIEDDQCFAAEMLAIEKMVREKLSLFPQ